MARMRFTMRQPAAPGTVMAPGCFDRHIGQTGPVTTDGQTAGRARLVAADGRSAVLPFETDEPVPGLPDDPPAVSLGFR